MAYLNKDAYQGKKEWAAKRNAQNAEIESLTDEQHEYLEELCEFRHFLHTHWDEAFHCESFDYDRITDEASVYGSNPLISSGRELFGVAPFIARDLVSDDDAFTVAEEDELEGEDRDELYSEYYNANCRLLSAINEEIESFLRKVDQEHGTQYCPTGATRIY